MNFDGRNLGHLAASCGRVEIVDYLAQSKRYDFSMKDRWGKSPLDIIKWSDKFSNSYVHNLQQSLKVTK